MSYAADTATAAETLAELRRIETEISAALAAMRAANDTLPCDHAEVARRCRRLEDLHMAQADVWWGLCVTGGVSAAANDDPASADVVQLLARAAGKAGNDAAEQSRAWRTHGECAATAADAAAVAR